jgi:DNA-directed RNA polymerase specialized sigma24 family protein
VSHVSNDDVAVFLPRVHYFARRFQGVQGAEYDDLVQEASIYVLVQLQVGKTPSGQGMKNAMRQWVRKCARRGLGHSDPPAE